MFGVWCEVYGMLGHRAAWLKENGEIVRYATREEAEAEAKRSNDSTADNPRASFYYSARALP